MPKRPKLQTCPVCGKRKAKFVKGKCKACYDIVLKEEFKLKRPERIWSTTTIRDHEKMGYEVLITADQLESKALMTRECEICGRDLNYKRGKGGVMVNSPHLDRKYNENVIRLDNIMILCQTCSVFKSDRKLEDFEDFLTTQVEKHKQKWINLADLEMRIKDKKRLG